MKLQSTKAKSITPLPRKIEKPSRLFLHPSAARPSSRWKTRRFPPLPHGRFGFIGDTAQLLCCPALLRPETFLQRAVLNSAGL
jgi:hypothetical protein